MTSVQRSATELARDHAAWSTRAASGGRVALLHIGPDDTVLVVGGDAGTAATLALGARRTAQAFFGHDLPTPQELEAAIDTVEDEVMRAAGVADDGASLASSDPALRQLAGGAAVMSLETVEAQFQCLASAALGDPGAAHGLPAGREAAATLLILRELMHHLGFTSIAIIDAPPAPGG